MKNILFATAIAVICIILNALPASTAEQTDTAARIEHIRTQYGIEVRYNAYGEQYLDQQLSSVEAALPYLGKTFLNKVRAVTVVGRTPPFHIRISDELPGELAIAGRYYISLDEHTVNLYPTHSYLPTCLDVVHEFGHAVPYLCGGTRDIYAELTALNGPYNDGVFDGTHYVSAYAMTNVSEDLAELFAHMILGGGESPYSAGVDTVLYRKYLLVQEYLLDMLGPNSVAAQRASAFLGIELSAA